ncbi:hypothetical protein HS962_03485 [Pantoea sp. BIGb0393]|uniref:SGNH/GDSL hydrolase family protein n=1 Tax=Pantoea nemavictus TaxID=2726955 RepID=A0ABU8PNI6_9GAMM|nr:hypothetical protein [Pantoea nemavictus]MBA0035308.1 hypothetical protein [Pantoea nemavictus]
MKNKWMFLIYFVVFLSTMAGYYKLYSFQIGRSVKAEWWLVDVQHKKESLAKNVGENRIIIASGSNGLFGINSKLMSELTARPVVNMAMHGSLDISYYRKLLDRTVRKGDIVIMPLEYGFYFRKDMYSDWFVNNMLAWGSDYIDSLSMYGKAVLVTYTTFERVMEGALSTTKRLTTPVIYIDAYKGNPNGRNYGYRYTSLNSTGDMNIDPKGMGFVENTMNHKGYYSESLSYGKKDLVIEKYSEGELIKIRDMIKAKGAELYITWPASMKTEYFNADDAESSLFAESLDSNLKRIGLNTICDHFYANLSPDLFLDSTYHLNASGANQRTKLLSQCVSSEIFH